MRVINIFTFFNEYWLLYAIYNKLFTGANLSLFLTSTLFVVSQVSKIFFDILFGFILGKYDRKYIFIAAIIGRGIAVGLWIFAPGKISFFIGMALIGFHISAFLQHFEGYLYDITHNKAKFPKILGRYYAIMNLGILGSSSFLAYCPNISTSQILKIQFFVIIISLFWIIHIPNSKIFNSKPEYTQKVLSLEILPLILALGAIEGMFMSLANMISVIVEYFAPGGNLTPFILAFMALIKIPLNYMAGYIKILRPVFYIQILALSIIPFIILGKTFAIIGTGIYFIFYTILIIHLYAQVHKIVLPSKRMLTATYITVFISIFTIIYDISIGILGIKNGLILGFFAIALMLCCMRKKIVHLY